MAITRLKRYFAPIELDISRVRSIDNALTSWTGAGPSYLLEYPATDIGASGTSRIADVTTVFAEDGPTSRIRAHSRNSSGKEGIFDSTHRTFVSLEFYSKERNPKTPLDSLAETLGLQPLKRIIESAFIAHPFDDKGKAYALELRDFLEAYGIRTKTGEEFRLSPVPDKIRDSIDQHDIFVGIVHPQEDSTWTTNELTYAYHKRKLPYVIEEIGTNHKAALLGDWENIPFHEGHISESFTKILQGFKTFRGES